MLCQQVYTLDIMTVAFSSIISLLYSHLVIIALTLVQAVSWLPLHIAGGTWRAGWVQRGSPVVYNGPGMYIHIARIIV